MADLAKGSCGHCTHCGNGVPFDKFYFFCVYCSVMVCQSCTPKHPNTHRPGLRRTVDKMLPRGAHASGIKCGTCQGDAEQRVECNSCALKACMGCWFNKPEEFQDHEHKAITFIRLPDDYNLHKYDLECTSCMLGSSLSHCGRCCEGIMEGERCYECVGCLQTYGSTRRVCESCLPIVQREHTQGHPWISLVFREIKADDEKHCGGRCATCLKESVVDLKAKTEHPHKDFIIEMGSIEKQFRSHIQYRSCPRRGIKKVRGIDYKVEDLHGNETNCQCCHKPHMIGGKFYYCIKCGWQCCNICYENGIANHPHPQFAAYLKYPVPSEEAWKGLLPDGPGRRWCDLCKGTILSEIEAHFRCRKCNDFDICDKCFSSTSLDNMSSLKPSHACGEWPEMNFIDPRQMGQDWTENQIALLQAHTSELKRQQHEEEREIFLAATVEERAAGSANFRRLTEEERLAARAKAQEEADSASKDAKNQFEESKHQARLQRSADVEVAKGLPYEQMEGEFEAANAKFTAAIDAATEAESIASDLINQKKYEALAEADAYAKEELERLAETQRAASAQDAAVRAAERQRQEREAAELAEALKRQREWEEAKQAKARLDAEKAEAQRRAAAPKVVAPKLAVPAQSARVRAPSPSPAVGRGVSNLAPPQRPAHRSRSSSGLGGLFKGALQLTNAVLKAENAFQGGGGGGGNANFVNFNNGGGGGGMDMSSFWAPINSAAQDPIQ